MFRVFILTVAVFSILLFSCKKDSGNSDPDDSENTVTDIDGNVYKTVKIGNQVWMAENLNVSHYNDGAEIFNATASATNPESWIEKPGGLRCYYDNEQSNGNVYGQIYNWAAVNSGKLAPNGWHIPTKQEWETLIAFLGGDVIAGVKLKAITLWDNGSITPGDNSSGFNAFASGVRSSHLGMFAGKGFTTGFWSSTKQGEFLYSYVLTLNSSMVSTVNKTSEREGLSVRCIKN